MVESVFLLLFEIELPKELGLKHQRTIVDNLPPNLSVKCRTSCYQLEKL